MTITELKTLLSSLLDYFPWPATWTGQLQAKATSRGPAATRENVRCLTCAGTGRLPNKRPCHECKGQGSWNWDPYVGRMIGLWEPGSDESGNGVQERRWKDRTLDALECQHERRETPVFARLVAAVDSLPRGQRTLVIWHYVLEFDRPNRYARVALAALHASVVDVPAPRWIVERARQRAVALRAASGKSADRSARRERDRLIRAMHAAGHTHQAIADLVGVSRVRVTQVLRTAA